jgi:hypothetical protein
MVYDVASSLEYVALNGTVMEGLVSDLFEGGWQV